MAAEDLDLVVHLGDYIYERRRRGHASAGRTCPPRRDVLAHGLPAPVRPVQARPRPAGRARDGAVGGRVHDDHEVENNWAGDHSQPDTEPDQDPAVFRLRRAAAYQAYYENLPLRRSSMPHGAERSCTAASRSATCWPRSTCSTPAGSVDQQRHRRGAATATRAWQSCSWRPEQRDLAAATACAPRPPRWNVLGNQIFMRPGRPPPTDPAGAARHRHVGRLRRRPAAAARRRRRIRRSRTRR